MMKLVSLVMLDAEAIATILANPKQFLKDLNSEATPVDLLAQVVTQARDFQAAHGATAPWLGYLALDPYTSEIVGSCSYKGNPTPEGLVEIAYFTFPAHEDCGYATGMAQDLLAEAFVHPEVNAVIAHTQPKVSASTRVLEKVGLQKTGTVEDPEDGPVWRWELHR
ncbi:MAG: GNAT family N-acetyltransferase [Lentisphaerae bacterium]|nr:GNAT family N-acetyltransferase [Lentisphaerota bacterium]